MTIDSVDALKERGVLWQIGSRAITGWFDDKTDRFVFSGLRIGHYDSVFDRTKEKNLTPNKFIGVDRTEIEVGLGELWNGGNA